MKKTLLAEFKPLLPYIYKYRFRYATGLICLIIVDIAQILIPQWTRRAINIIQTGNFAMNTVLFNCAAIVITMLVVCIGRFLWRYFLGAASRNIETELREKYFERLMKLNNNFYEENKTGDLMARSTKDIDAVRMALGWGLVTGIDGTVMAAAILFVIFYQSPALALFTVIPVPFIILLIVILGRMIGKRAKNVQEAYSSMSEAAQESFAGVRVIKSFVRETEFINKFENQNDNYVKTNMSLVRVNELFFPMILFFSELTALIVVFVGGRSVVLGTMQAGDLVALIAYIQMLVWPMLGAGFVINIIQRGAVSMKRISEILEREPSIKECSAKGIGFNIDDLPAGAPIIEIKNLSFAYNESRPVLHNINLSINEGEWLGIFGRTGSGKTTLIKLLPRVVEASGGTIFIKGRDIRDWPLAKLRALFSTAPQDSFLFSDTIKNNILYASEDGGEQKLSSIIDTASLGKDIDYFSEGINTLVGERGLTLSGGQKQRITIGRAAIMNSDILVLDDSLSACDAETEKNILKNIEQMRRGMTTIIVSHRISAFRQADKVAVLEDGHLAAFAAPSELLLDRNSYYAKTARIQNIDLR